MEQGLDLTPIPTFTTVASRSAMRPRAILSRIVKLRSDLHCPCKNAAYFVYNRGSQCNLNRKHGGIC